MAIYRFLTVSRLRWILYLMVTVLLMAYICAPYLPRLLLEGAPSPVWPAPGYFADIPGRQQPEPLPVRHGLPDKPDPKLLSLFRQADGKAMVAYHHGAIVLEYFADGFNSKSRFNSFSMVKSLIGALLLKAVDEQRLPGLDIPIGEILTGVHPSLEVIPIRDFTDMRSGVTFEPGGILTASGMRAKNMESFPANPFGPLARLHFMGPETVIRQLRVKQAQSHMFSYQNINTVLMGKVIEKIYSAPLEHLLLEKIWRPAGAGKAYWRKYSRKGAVNAYCCLYATAYDWVKVALFLARNGSENKAFFSMDSWREFFGDKLSTGQLQHGDYHDQTRHDILDRPGESLQGRFTYFMGHGGQTTYIMPDKDLIVVRFGGKQQLLHSTLYGVWRSIRSP